MSFPEFSSLGWLGELLLTTLHPNLPFISKLSNFLLGVSTNTGSLSEELHQLENLLRTFLFKDNFTLSLKAKQGTTDLKTMRTDRSGLGEKESAVLFKGKSEDVKEFGDIEVKAVFETKKVKFEKEKNQFATIKANIFEFALFLQKFPEFEDIFKAVGDLIEAFCSSKMPNGRMLNSADLIKDIKILFPNFRHELGKLIVIEESDIYVRDCHEKGYFYFNVYGPVNVEGMKEFYPSLHYSFEHFQEVRIKVLKYPANFSAEDFDNEKKLEAYCEIADYCYELVIQNKGKKDCTYDIKFCTQKDDRKLVWMNDEPEPVDFGLKDDVFDFDLNNPQTVLVTIDVKIKVQELGCTTSIKLPKIINKLAYIPEKHSKQANLNPGRYEAKPGFHISILHIHKESYLTRILTAPFINLTLVRQLMRNKFFIHLSLHSDDDSNDDKYLAFQMRAVFLPPPMVLQSCIRFYVKSALKQQGDLHLYRDLTLGSGKDLKHIYEVMTK